MTGGAEAGSEPAAEGVGVGAVAGGVDSGERDLANFSTDFKIPNGAAFVVCS